MSVYICTKCNILHDTVSQMKHCTHVINKVKKVKKAKESVNGDRYDYIITNLSSDKVSADDVKFVASKLLIQYINKEVTIKQIRDKLKGE